MFLQPASIRALKFANVAGVLLLFRRVTIVAFPPAWSLGGVLSADVGVKGGLVGALVGAEVAGIGQIVLVLRPLFFFFRFVF